MENVESLDFQVWQIDKTEENESAKMRLELYEVEAEKFVVELLTDDDTGRTHTIIAREFLAYEYAKNYFDMVERNTDAYMWLLTSFDRKEEVMLCRTHHDDLLSKPMFANAVRKADGKLWHSVEDLTELLKWQTT